MRPYQTRIRRMRPHRRYEPVAEHPQTWFRDEDIARAKAHAEHARLTGRIPAPERG